ncbi:hypothetical protein GIB67_016894 [Kingdonia uniflora]|uniref:Endonuclease V n=1 Tax=Kingdonia uniflora TaxID=39325 RepID=A0A7J7M3E0_9MAGN|nr:hypothetical protein GIB67_016894 [Kingdonia uniflora]
METSATTDEQQQINDWIEAQELLKRRLILEDDFSWGLDVEKLRYVGGVDLSFSKDDPSIACAALIVLDTITLKVVYQDFSIVRLHIPYIPGFLAFREAPVLLELLQTMKCNTAAHHLYPQLLMVDGNGFGLACHLGVLADLPTIGIGKNLHHVDGLTQSGARQSLKAQNDCTKNLVILTGNSGNIWGAAMRSTECSLKPIYISTGHRISLNTAINVVKLLCKHRVPEPIRQADIRSREFLQKHPTVINSNLPVKR